MLVDILHFIENIKIDDKTYYGLILSGFKDKLGIKELQRFLSKNGLLQKFPQNKLKRALDDSAEFHC